MDGQTDRQSNSYYIYPLELRLLGGGIIIICIYKLKHPNNSLIIFIKNISSPTKTYIYQYISYMYFIK